ncbi:MBL fold metallo-hydrolase [Taibaiella lutea]|uniref:MBL fold metallo-hydrolase n=1 Tax=Taibaiella lutea TaxID=2608001 RepID=A0A5M6CE05_9BACT|nr:MBL fold metallo-hydrolase [Taibaiella lutea]KAA5532690.1 MBL fold metallo-hydrolase [Taibaiella lutea]
MRLKVLGTGSNGNCYILENDIESLVIELGIPFSKIKQGLGFDLSKVTAALCTHNHNDHSKSLSDALNAGIKVIVSKGTTEAKNVQHHGITHIRKGQKIKVGNFEILAFDIHHDVPEPLGFLIRHEECGLVCFLTDTTYCNYKFPGLNNIIVEANYCEDIIYEKLLADKKFLRDRVINSHMSINTCRDFLLANDLSAVNNIVLIHLSDSNSNAMEFEKKIVAATGKKVTIADAGIVIENFNKSAI